MKLSSKSLKTIRAILLQITPDISPILDELTQLSKKRVNAGDVSEDEAAAKGIEIIVEMVEILLDRQYDKILRILAALYETSPDELEEKEFGEIINMVEETLKDEVLMRFFPRFARLKRKTPLDI